MSDEIEEAWKQVLGSMGVLDLEHSSNVIDIRNTPKRVAKMWMDELLIGYRPIETLKKVFTTFEPDDDMSGQDMILIRNIGFTSFCGHHMLPFSGKAHVGYIPNEKIAGLSKLARAVEYYSRRLQTQERMTGQIADFLYEELGAVAVQVVTTANHYCMGCRGVKKEGATTVLAALRGAANEPHVKEEFYSLLHVP